MKLEFEIAGKDWDEAERKVRPLFSRLNRFGLDIGNPVLGKKPRVEKHPVTEQKSFLFPLTVPVKNVRDDDHAHQNLHRFISAAMDRVKGATLIAPKIPSTALSADGNLVADKVRIAARGNCVVRPVPTLSERAGYGEKT
jgi:hypothetical protein